MNWILWDYKSQSRDILGSITVIINRKYQTGWAGASMIYPGMLCSGPEL